jgi:hypothetical protein
MAFWTLPLTSSPVNPGEILEVSSGSFRKTQAAAEALREKLRPCENPHPATDLNSFDRFASPFYNRSACSEQPCKDRRMSSETSDTRWLHLLKAGNHAAAQVLWERYFRLLVSCARQRLGVAPRIRPPDPR